MSAGDIFIFIRRYAFQIGALAVLAGFFAAWVWPSCTPAPDRGRQDGSQGFRVWKGPTFMSFEHDGGRVCVPEGWEALGDERSGQGWAQFAGGKTGALYESAAFESIVTEPRGSGYSVSVVYPKEARSEDVAEYVRIVTAAFEHIGALYPQSGAAREHTVFVTAGLAGNSINEGTRVYPDPGPDVTYFVRTPNQSRAEELLVHAVAHLYNRFRDDLGAYLESQTPLPAEEFQEAEASWAETAFSTTARGRATRINYLYNIHLAVRTKNFLLIEEPPFDDQAAFEALVPSAIVPEGSNFLDYQYGHYVLAPLALVAVEGLLQMQGADTDVPTILTKLHEHPDRNFFAELSAAVTPDDVLRVESWMRGESTIPRALVDAGVAYYDSL